MLSHRINQYLDVLGIIVEEQNGFRSKRSCEDHIFSLTSIIQHRKASKLDTFPAFIDMNKAFDSINRPLLLYKLLRYNIQGKMYNAIKALYCRTFSCINLNGHLTEWFESLVGVRQGDNLSPTLFNIFLNDLANELNAINLGIKMGDLKICMLLYADDIAIISENEQKLQKLLDHVHEWCKKWQLNLNIDKTQIVHFRKSQKQRTKFEFKIGLHKVMVVSKYKYLGTFLDEFLTFSENAQILADSAGRGLGSVFSKFKLFKDCGYRTYEKMYNTSVVPIFSYGAGIWGFNKDGPAEKIYNRALRYFLGVNKFTANLFLQGDSGWLPPKYVFYLSALRYWNKLCQFDNTRIPKQIFNWTFQFKKHYTWVKNIQKVFDLLNMSSYFLERRKVDLNFCCVKAFKKVGSLVWETNQNSGPMKKSRLTFQQKIISYCLNIKDH